MNKFGILACLQQPIMQCQGECLETVPVSAALYRQGPLPAGSEQPGPGAALIRITAGAPNPNPYSVSGPAEIM